MKSIAYLIIYFHLRILESITALANVIQKLTRRHTEQHRKNKMLDPLRAANILLRKGISHTRVLAIEASSVIL